MAGRFADHSYSTVLAALLTLPESGNSCYPERVRRFAHVRAQPRYFRTLAISDTGWIFKMSGYVKL
jgi:hypothetical protein